MCRGYMIEKVYNSVIVLVITTISPENNFDWEMSYVIIKPFSKTILCKRVKSNYNQKMKKTDKSSGKINKNQTYGSDWHHFSFRLGKHV